MGTEKDLPSKLPPPYEDTSQGSNSSKDLSTHEDAHGVNSSRDSSTNASQGFARVPSGFARVPSDASSDSSTTNDDGSDDGKGVSDPWGLKKFKAKFDKDSDDDSGSTTSLSKAFAGVKLSHTQTNRLALEWVRLSSSEELLEFDSFCQWVKRLVGAAPVLETDAAFENFLLAREATTFDYLFPSRKKKDARLGPLVPMIRLVTLWDLSLFAAGGHKLLANRKNGLHVMATLSDPNQAAEVLEQIRLLHEMDLPVAGTTTSEVLAEPNDALQDSNDKSETDAQAALHSSDESEEEL